MHYLGWTVGIVIGALALLGCSDDGLPADSTGGATATGTADTTGNVTASASDPSTSATMTGTTGTTQPTSATESGTTSVDTGSSGSSDSSGSDSSGSTGTTGSPGSSSSSGSGSSSSSSSTSGGLADCNDQGPCGETQYCNYLDDLCGDGVAGMCQDLPDMCLAVVNPVCGCDGVTYTNGCMAALLGMTDFAFLGSCEDGPGA